MLFHTYSFWAFFVVVTCVYYALDHKKQNRLLLLASYCFYGMWDWRFLFLIFLSTIVDYLVGIKLPECHKSRRYRLVWISCLVNLGILGIFKYFGFFAAELSAFLNAMGIDFLNPTMDIVLPVGISFYTFQTMSYTIDVYRGKTKPCRDLLDFALYVCFFPQLVAGPIERSARLIPQLQNKRHVDGRAFQEGLYHVLIGLFKKVVIADNMAVIVDAVFNSDQAFTGIDTLLGVYAFAFQIYGDFSGYSSIAKGIAKWLGIDLMDNFRRPYFATNPSDFWRRWHISLSQWLRDYLYIPLGGNRLSSKRTKVNLMATMVLGGLWHGANWTFLVWGGIHGFILIAFRQAPATLSRVISKCPKPIRQFLFFNLICVTWLYFRAGSLSQASFMLMTLFTNLEVSQFSITALSLIIFYCGPFLLYEIWLERKDNELAIVDRSWMMRCAVYLYAVLMLTIFGAQHPQEFIYFQF